MIGVGRLLLLPPDRARRPAAGARPATPPRRATRAARASRASGLAVTLFSIFVLAAVTGGWLFRNHIALDPESRLGQALGITGGTMMLLLTLYSARKRLRFMRSWGALSHWFRIHMLLGVLGPLLILFHSNFHLGATNSAVAVVSMLIVAASGVVGRYIYTRISHGLYGARATFEELHAQLDANTHTLGERLAPTSRAAQRLAAFAATARAPHRTIGRRLVWLVALPLHALLTRRRVLRDIHAALASEAARCGWDEHARGANEAATRHVVRAYIAALVKEVQFSTYERLFSLWHALHVPLFVMLVLTGIMHVVAVHMY